MEQTYQEGAFTQGHPNLLRSLSERTLRQIISWLDQPEANAAMTKTAECPLALTLNAECAHHLEWLSRAAHITPTVLVEKLINEEVRRRYGSLDES